MRPIVTLAALLVAAGCVTRDSRGPDSAALRADSIRTDSLARARQDSINRAAPGYVIDSILPPDEEARRFRAGLRGDSATEFVGGERSREALVRRFVRSLAAGDTNALRAMVVTGREFVDIYYPGSLYAKPPYHQPVGFAWRMIQGPSNSGFTRLVRRLAGHRMQFVSEKCEPRLVSEGKVHRHTGCLVRLVDERGDTVTKRLFGSIVEHRGRFKFLSYTNDM